MEGITCAVFLKCLFNLSTATKRVNAGREGVGQGSEGNKGNWFEFVIIVVFNRQYGLGY